MALMGLAMLRYGEIGLKGQNRAYFTRRLRHNVRQCLKANGIEGRVWQEGQRLYLEAMDLEAAMEAVQRVAGLVSLSPVEVVPADLAAISAEAVALARRLGVGDGSFRVTANRADKSFALISPEIQRQVGAAVVAATGARVRLSDADVDIGIEVQRGRALIFGERIPGPGGLPLGSQGKVVALLSSGIDSPVAAWLMMKRGCGVVPVHFALDQAQEYRVLSIVEALNRHAYGWPLRPIVLSHSEVVGPVVERLQELRQERWACLLCKRAMLAHAAGIAQEIGASALVTGDSLGQVASQTLSNLEVISHGIPKPILRPLIGMDKTEIMDLARRIGTYETSAAPSMEPDGHGRQDCPFLPYRPLTQATLEKLLALLDEMEGPAEQRGQAGRTDV
jgi:tRNA uracil 4-sulfurtransferase